MEAETQALDAVLQGTSAHLAMFTRMQEAVEQGILQKQDEIDKEAFLSLVSNTKAHILKLQSLECHFLNATYKPDDVAALGKIHRELSTRLEQVRVELMDAQKRLSVYRGLGPGFKDQVAAFRRLHQQLLDAQYMLESFKALNTDLQHGATDMQMDGDDGDFMTGTF
ncbi:hypothetical protein HXX76_010379 [Chlamydomonas incerta]|uniref:Uncharacterized protein n=1 Tax=Chlamydomonas incerta TaxID=51695 RepID=A0A835SNI4_CHLIN|nr:hypothetical protein HXX76_010379 [Chlamydomonas incerta]|eukprot:KAG2430284.1 hypothetical protein HXX76_010379 [Chlamydomonas incerta]